MVPLLAAHGITIDCLLMRSIVCTEKSKPRLTAHFLPSTILMQATSTTASAWRVRILCGVSVCQLTHWLDQGLCGIGSPNLTGAPPIPPSLPAQPEPAGVRLRRPGRHPPPGYLR